MPPFSLLRTILNWNMYSDIYGISKTTPTPTKDGSTTNGTQPAAKKTKTKSVIHLSLRDSLPAYGPIASMTFSLAKNGVSPCSISITVVVPLLLTAKFSSRIVLFQNLWQRQDRGLVVVSHSSRYFSILFHYSVSS